MPDKRCDYCGGPLYPPELVLEEWTIPPDADAVCAFCGHGYKWTGNPQTLEPIPPAKEGILGPNRGSSVDPKSKG